MIVETVRRVRVLWGWAELENFTVICEECEYRMPLRTRPLAEEFLAAHQACHAR